jgi:hypothetical protein
MNVRYGVGMDPKTMLWNAPPAAGAPAPTERLWTLTKNGKRFTCELRSHGKYGWECQFLEDDEFIDGRRFAMRSQAIDWANIERDEHEAEGWIAC